ELPALHKRRDTCWIGSARLLRRHLLAAGGFYHVIGAIPSSPRPEPIRRLLAQIADVIEQRVIKPRIVAPESAWRTRAGRALVLVGIQDLRRPEFHGEVAPILNRFDHDETRGAFDPRALQRRKAHRPGSE